MCIIRPLLFQPAMLTANQCSLCKLLPSNAFCILFTGMFHKASVIHGLLYRSSEVYAYYRNHFALTVTDRPTGCSVNMTANPNRRVINLGPVIRVRWTDAEQEWNAVYNILKNPFAVFLYHLLWCSFFANTNSAVAKLIAPQRSQNPFNSISVRTSTPPGPSRFSPETQPTPVQQHQYKNKPDVDFVAASHHGKRLENSFIVGNWEFRGKSHQFFI